MNARSIVITGALLAGLLVSGELSSDGDGPGQKIREPGLLDRVIRIIFFTVNQLLGTLSITLA